MFYIKNVNKKTKNKQTKKQQKKTNIFSIFTVLQNMYFAERFGIQEARHEKFFTKGELNVISPKPTWRSHFFTSINYWLDDSWCSLLANYSIFKRNKRFIFSRRQRQFNINKLLEKIVTEFEDHYKIRLMSIADGTYDGMYSRRLVHHCAVYSTSTPLLCWATKFVFFCCCMK